MACSISVQIIQWRDRSRDLSPDYGISSLRIRSRIYGDFAALISHWCEELVQYYYVMIICTTIWLGISPVELILGNYACSSFSWRRYPTWLKPWFSDTMVFCWFSSFSPTQTTDFLKKTKVSCVRRFFPWFLKTKQFFFFICLHLKWGPNGNIILFSSD